MNINKHKYLMMQILRDIYADGVLSNLLGFKGGTALMFFYDLPRFSVDLDFNLLNRQREQEVYDKVRGILLKYGSIHDEAMKYYGPIIVLDYGSGERKLKVEISNRTYPNHYEIRNLLGIEVKVLVAADMFAHKLCALLDRPEMTGRDIFDCWFFLRGRFDINAEIVTERTKMALPDYLELCIDRLEHTPDKQVMSGIGELVDSQIKTFARTKLRRETIDLLRFMRAFPSTK